MSIQAPQFVGASLGGTWAPLLAPGLSGGLMFEMEGFAAIGYDRDFLFDGNEWPWSRFVGNGQDVDGFSLRPIGWGNRLLWPSGNSTWAYWIYGQVKDENGNPLTSWVSLRVYYTATEALLYELEADGFRDRVVDDGGRFRLGVPDNTSDFYIVVYSQSPDRSGASARNLRGAA